MARKDERGVVIPAPLQFNNPAFASQPRYDDEHRGPAVTDCYELSQCWIDLAERSQGWPTPANLPSRMVEFAQSVPEDQRADWLRRQANLEGVDTCIANAMRSGELPIWVAPIGEPERLVAPGAIVEVDHATVVSGVYRPPNDRGWLYGRPLFVKRNDWAKFAARIDSAKKPGRKNGNSESSSHDGGERQWLRVSKAIRILHRILRSRLAGQEPAPWIEVPADPFDAEYESATHRHRRTARTSLTMRRALLSGDLNAFLVKEGLSHPLPGWAWKNASAAENAFHFNWLPLNPLLDHGLGEADSWRCFVSRAELKAWLSRSDISDIGDLPKLPAPYDQEARPDQLTFREPQNKPFVELAQALTWIAFGISVSCDEFNLTTSYEFGLFAERSWRDGFRAAMADFADQASAGKIRVRGRYVANYSDHSAAAQADTADLTDTQLRDFARFDSLHGGLERGAGLAWETEALEKALNGRNDGWREVEVSRTDLMKVFDRQDETARAIAQPIPATLPHIGPAMSLDEALSWLAHNRPSYDYQLWQNGAGEIDVRDPNGTAVELAEDGSPPQGIQAFRVASNRFHMALRDGSLASYVAPESGVALHVPRIYWNGVNPESLHHVYRGMSPEDQGAGCPILLSRQAFDEWRNAQSRPDHATPKNSKGRRGRTRGTGYQQADAPLLAKMKEAITSNPALNATSAARLFANEAEGASFEAKVDRLARSFRAGRNGE